MTYSKNNTCEIILIFSLSILLLLQITFAFSMDAVASNPKTDYQRQNICDQIGCGFGFKKCAEYTLPGPLDGPYTCFEGIVPVEEEISQK